MSVTTPLISIPENINISKDEIKFDKEPFRLDIFRQWKLTHPFVTHEEIKSEFDKFCEEYDDNFYGEIEKAFKKFQDEMLYKIFNIESLVHFLQYIFEEFRHKFEAYNVNYKILTYDDKYSFLVKVYDTPPHHLSGRISSFLCKFDESIINRIE